MKILSGELEPPKGTVSRPKKFGVLRQDQFAFDNFRVIDTVIMGNAPLWRALEERDALYAKPHDQLTDHDGMRLGELERSEEHTSELQSLAYLVCRLLLEKKKKNKNKHLC